MNWMLITGISLLILGLLAGGGYYYYTRYYNKKCCPEGFTQDYDYAVSHDAECDKKTKKCKKCIGLGVKAPKDWANDVKVYGGKGMETRYVTDPIC